LKEVTDTVERESDHTVLLYSETETLETTAEHPFYVDEQWKIAADLQAGDRITTLQGDEISITSTEFSYKPKKVFNFAVADWHTYFVGVWAWLVHNAQRCLSQMMMESQKWFQNVRRGYFFNLVWNSELRKQATEKGFKYLQEVRVILKRGGEGAIDGLIIMKDKTVKIIERKASDLTRVQESTIKGYIDDAAKYNGSMTIEGAALNVDKVILHVERKGELSEEVLKYASNKGVEIIDDISTIIK
jgi:hypothetical protein